MSETENIKIENEELAPLNVKERIEKSIREIRKELPCLDLRENEPMASHCSFKTGGNVRAFLVPQDINSMSIICSIIKDNMLMPYILGNGTNVVFPDEGCDELMVVSTEKLQGMWMLDENLIYAESGVSLSRLAGFAYENSLTGLEFASGIPGTVGGGTMMNAGAYGGELKDCIDTVVVYYLPEQRLYEMKGEQAQFSYRHSCFQTLPGSLILSVVFKLTKGDQEEIASKMKELNERRRDKQPLDFPSAGSAFKRPEGHYAAALIEEAGLKGFKVGGAEVSQKHAGFIVNTGNATSKDLYEVMDHVRHEVYEKTKVTLEPEIILIPPEYKLEDNGPKAEKHFVVGGKSFKDE